MIIAFRVGVLEIALNLNPPGIDDFWVFPDAAPLPDEREPTANVTTIDGIVPFDMQFGADPKKTVPSALRDTVFGQLEHGISEVEGDQTPAPALHTYAVLDAAKVQGLPELLQASGLPHRCLFTGAAYDDLKDVAPWVVQLTEESELVRYLFTKCDAPWCLWEKEPGILVRSNAEFDRLWAHLRKFTRVQDDTGKWFLVRFWDLRDVKSLEAAWGYYRGLFAEVSSVLLCLGQTTAIRIADPMHASAPKAQLAITASWKRHLASQHQVKFVRHRLGRDYTATARTLNDGLQDEFALHLTERFQRYGLTRGYSKETYLQAAMLLGTRFDEDPMLLEIRQVLEREKPCFERMLDIKSLMFQWRDDVAGPQFEHYARALSRFARLDEAQFARLALEPKPLETVIRLFPQKAKRMPLEAFEMLTDHCNAVAERCFEQSERRAGSIVVFAHAYLLGCGCLNDPLHDYIRRILRSDAPDKPKRLFRYGRKRARAMQRVWEKTFKEEIHHV